MVKHVQFGWFECHFRCARAAQGWARSRAGWGAWTRGAASQLGRRARADSRALLVGAGRWWTSCCALLGYGVAREWASAGGRSGRKWTMGGSRTSRWTATSWTLHRRHHCRLGAPGFARGPFLLVLVLRVERLAQLLNDHRDVRHTDAMATPSGAALGRVRTKIHFEG